MASHSTPGRIGIAGGVLAAAAIIGLSGLTGAAASAGPASTTTVERAAVTQPAPVTAPAVEPAPAPAPTTTVPVTTTQATVAPTTTTPPATTTTAPPAPTTTTPPPDPVPAPAPQAATQESREDRARRVFGSAVPEVWRADIEVRFEIIDGSTSWAYGDGRILVAQSHVDASEEYLADVLAHEFGHLIAFEYGTKAYTGAAPEGWPEPEHSPAEAWADCVQEAFTGRANPSHGLPPCGGAQLDWAASWLAGGPPPPPAD